MAKQALSDTAKEATMVKLKTLVVCVFFLVLDLLCYISAFLHHYISHLLTTFP